MLLLFGQLMNLSCPLKEQIMFDSATLISYTQDALIVTSLYLFMVAAARTVMFMVMKDTAIPAFSWLQELC